MSALHLIHGQAGSVDTDTALHGDVARQRLRCSNTNTPKARILGNVVYVAHTIDMSTDQMAA